MENKPQNADLAENARHPLLESASLQTIFRDLQPELLLPSIAAANILDGIQCYLFAETDETALLYQEKIAPHLTEYCLVSIQGVRNVMQQYQIRRMAALDIYFETEKEKTLRNLQQYLGGEDAT